MIGEKVVLRARMSAGDAHYAGELVNGSKICYSLAMEPIINKKKVKIFSFNEQESTKKR